MNDMLPTRKVSAGVLAGAIVVLVLYLVNLIWHVGVPGEVGSAITTLFTFVISWLIPDKYEAP